MAFPMAGEKIPADRNRITYDIVDRADRYLGGSDADVYRFPKVLGSDNDWSSSAAPLGRQIVNFSANRVGRDLSVSSVSPTVTSWLQEMMRQTDFHSMLIKGLRWGAAYGGFYMKPTVNARGLPAMQIVRPDFADPEWVAGQLKSVSFRVPLQPKDDKGREHFTLHEWHRRIPYVTTQFDGPQVQFDDAGNVRMMVVIDYALFKSRDDTDGGVMVPLDEHPDTVYLLDLPLVGNGMVARREMVGFDRIVAEYVPNTHGRHAGMAQNEGEPDLAGAYDLLDMVNVGWATTADELEKSLARIGVNPALMKAGKKGESVLPFFGQRTKNRGREFDWGQSVFVEIPGAPSDLGGGKGFEQFQWNMQLSERIEAINEMHLWVIRLAGWSPQSFGLRTEAGGDSGAAKEYREQQTKETVEKKRALLIEPLRRMLDNLARLGGLPSTEVTVSFPSQNVPTDGERADVIQKLAKSGVIPLEDIVQYWFYDLDPDEIAEKVAKMKTDMEARVAMGEDMSAADGANPDSNSAQ